MSNLIHFDSKLTRRGLAGTILVYKLAAALSEQGADLDAVEDVAKYAVTRLGTLGVGLDHCHVPGTKAGVSHLSADQVELVSSPLAVDFASNNVGHGHPQRARNGQATPA